MVVLLNHQVVEERHITSQIHVRSRCAEAGVGHDASADSDLAPPRWLQVAIQPETVGEHVEFHPYATRCLGDEVAVAPGEAGQFVFTDEVDSCGLSQPTAEVAPPRRPGCCAGTRARA